MNPDRALPSPPPPFFSLFFSNEPRSASFSTTSEIPSLFMTRGNFISAGMWEANNVGRLVGDFHQGPYSPVGNLPRLAGAVVHSRGGGGRRPGPVRASTDGLF